MSDINQVKENIKEAIGKMHKGPAFYKKKILTNLFEKCQYVSDSEFYDIVGETFKSNPTNFMKYIYNDLRHKFSKLNRDEKRREMDKYIIEKFCLYSGEQILHECDGRIHLMRIKQYTFRVRSGTIFVTNYRIIAQGEFKATMWARQYGRLTEFGGDVRFGLKSQRKKAQRAEKAISDIPDQEELPCYGYIFPIKNLYNLRKRNHRATADIKYEVKLDDQVHTIQFSSPSFKREIEENIDKVCDILLKSSE